MHQPDKLLLHLCDYRNVKSTRFGRKLCIRKNILSTIQRLRTGANVVLNSAKDGNPKGFSIAATSSNSCRSNSRCSEDRTSLIQRPHGSSAAETQAGVGLSAEYPDFDRGFSGCFAALSHHLEIFSDDQSIQIDVRCHETVPRKLSVAQQAS